MDTKNPLPAPALASQTLPLQLMATLERLDKPELRTQAKLELMGVVNQLLPEGKPDYVGIVRYPKISDLIPARGYAPMLMLVSAIIRDFCASFNIVRNMNAEQIVEAAGMLLDECGNFRLEDYILMFAMAKRGELYEVRDRIDLQIITAIWDNYWMKRHNAGKCAQSEQILMLDALGPSVKESPHFYDNKQLNDAAMTEDQHLAGAAGGLAAAIGNLKEKFNAHKK